MTAPATATASTDTDAAPRQLPKGWHDFPKDRPRTKSGSFLVKLQAPGIQKTRLALMEWGEVEVTVPGAIVIAHGFHLEGDRQPVAGVQAWREVPASWLD